MDTEKLKNRDYYLVLDKSGSMEEKDTPSGQTRWDYAKESVLAIAHKLAEYDPDGITIVPFAGNHKMYSNTTPDKIDQIYAENSPMGGTMLAPALNAVFADYTSNKKAGNTKANGAIAVVITDGTPQDEQQAARAIVDFTKTLNDGREEFGIEFIQVGKDKHATDYLKRLDDHLSKEGAKYDIVNTKTMEELENVGLTEAIVASLTD